MLKRKRDDDEESSENEDLIHIDGNKITFYCDVTYKSCFELIKAIDKVKKSIKSENISEYE